MTYKEINQMRKEAGWQRYFPRLATRIALNKAWKHPTLQALPWFVSGAVRDIPGAAGKAAVRGSSAGLSLLLRLGTGRSSIIRGSRLKRALGNLGLVDAGVSMVSPSWRETQLNWLGKLWAKGKDQAIEGSRNFIKSLDEPDPAVPIGTTKFSPEALISTFNPISGITGDKDYVPEQLVNAFQKVLPGHKGELAAHAATKIGASAVLAAGLVGAYRLARHVSDMGAIDSKGSAGKDMSSQLSTTFSGNLGDGEEEKKQKKAAAEQYAPQSGDIMAPSNFSMQNLTGTALPLASMLLAAGLTYKGIDAAFDKIRNKRLDNAIAQKEQAVKNLITARAKLAKGELSAMAVQNAVAPIADKDIYTKAASQDKEAVVQEAVQLFGTLSAAVILASAIGSYAYTSAADENNIKYKAYKKALRTYAKNKSGMTPITVAPSDAASYFASIDAAKDQKPATPRNMPSYDPDSLNKPISTSF